MTDDEWCGAESVAEMEAHPMVGRPSLTIDNDGTPVISIPIDERGNTASVRCSSEGLAEFIGEVKVFLMRSGEDQDLQKKVGKAMIDILGKWVRS